jgi:hypothetical protein
VHAKRPTSSSRPSSFPSWPFSLQPSCSSCEGVNALAIPRWIAGSETALPRPRLHGLNEAREADALHQQNRWSVVPDLTTELCADRFRASTNTSCACDAPTQPVARRT